MLRVDRYHQQRVGKIQSSSDAKDSSIALETTIKIQRSVSDVVLPNELVGPFQVSGSLRW